MVVAGTVLFTYKQYPADSADARSREIADTPLMLRCRK